MQGKSSDPPKKFGVVAIEKGAKSWPLIKVANLYISSEILKCLQCYILLMRLKFIHIRY